MENLVLEIGIAVTLFVGTNIDDIFVLLAFYSDSRFKPKEIVLGQYLGIFALAFASVALSLGAKQLPHAYIGLLGLVPLGLGLKKLGDFFRCPGNEQSEDVIAKGSFQKSTKVLTVVGITMANGGDNVGVYVPIFATKHLWVLSVYLLIFFLMTGIWCSVALYLIHHKHIGAVIKRFSHYVVPWVFVGLGGYILYEAGSFRLFF